MSKPLPFPYPVRSGVGALLCAVAASCLTLPDAVADGIPGYAVVPIVLTANSNQAVARVTINGQPISLLLNTGCTNTMLDSRFYKFLGTKAGSTDESKLPPELKGKTATANGEKVSIGYVNNFKVASADLGGGPVEVADFSRQFDGYNSRNPREKIGGILGEDIMRKYGVIIDWRRRGVYFNLDPSKRMKLGPGLKGAGWTAVPMTTTDARHFSVACIVDGKPVRLIVDTGATYTCFDQKAITLEHTLVNRHTRSSMAHLDSNRLTMSMFGMDSNAYLAKLENWKIGNYVVPSSVVVTTSMPAGLSTRETGGSGPIVGVLGAEVLASNNAILDVAGSTLYLKPSPPVKSSLRW